MLIRSGPAVPSFPRPIQQGASFNLSAFILFVAAELFTTSLRPILRLVPLGDE
jgi:hypothetical protein